MMKNRTPQQLGQVRLIAGRWRGKKLTVLAEPGLRPTSDRWRETLFNWLAPQLPDAQVLDCFAGSGALGLEALSRGANHICLLEHNPNVVQQLQQTLQQLAVSSQQAIIYCVDAQQYLAQTAERRFTLVFLDPPFHQAMLPSLITLLEQHHWLTEEAWIYLETEIDWQPTTIPTHWQLHREKLSNQVAYRLYQRMPQLEYA
ncbi:MAG: 16S rRNA (guanine(966)-N(2))-methyltransferase RsmD [Candidatus Symbiodolus clandestinus]